ncbi:MAG: putative bifunctional diguanylate cyclase/phosphodiesterase [Thalassotalea sp.]
MNKALFIVSLQHELAMAIGNDLDLKVMLKHFIQVCFNRLSLCSAHVYIHQNSQGVPIIANDDSVNNGCIVQTRHFLSMPKNIEGKAWQTTPVLVNFSKKLITGHKNLKLQQDNGHYLYGFILPDHGVIIFETHFEFEAAIEKVLLPILSKLAKSCYTNIVYDSLLIEMSARKNAEDRVSYQAQHDALTGLSNRQYFKGILEKTYYQAINEGSLGCVLFLDLNRFKPINDAMGHSVGDEILSTLAERLQYLVSENKYVARFGGDEFILLLANLPKAESEAELIVSQFIAQINESINSPVFFEGNIFKLTCSIGYHFFPHQYTQLIDVIPFADIAMYEAKRTGAVAGLKYQKAMSDKINLKNDYVEEMKQAIENNEFCLYYQPQYNHQQQIIGAEALLRWPHPTRGMESPEVYIPIAEDSDLILDIGTWVLEQACRDLKKLTAHGLPDFFKKLSINVSPKQLIQDDFKDLVLTAVETNQVPANLLGLELTENVLVESFSSTISLIEALKEHGIECSIDDFGTGYSSLTYLKRIPASLLKIDRSFVTDIHKETEGVAIAKMIIGLGKALNMNVLAEGVETEQELNCLMSLGCYQYQGYYFSKPLPFEQFIQLLPVKTPFMSH